MLGFFHSQASCSNLINVAGTLSPDATGDYAYSAMHVGVRAFKLTTGDFYLWYTAGTDTWTISVVLGTEGEGYWTKVGSIWGTYTPGGTATGDAEVSPN